jgi:hypothetical protein
MTAALFQGWLEASSNSEHEQRRPGTPFDCTDDKGNLAKENIKHWTTNPGEEACTLIQNHCVEAGNPLTFLPCPDCEAPGNPKGIAVLAGGNHGNVALRCHCKFHLSSLQQRKAIGDLSHQCPRAQRAFIACNADKHPMLHETVMMPMEEGRQHLTASQAIAASPCNPVLFCTWGVEQAAFKIGEDMGGKEVTGKLPTGAEETPQLGNKFKDVLKESIMLAVAVSKFNDDLRLGDIKFFAHLLGMVNSDTCWRLHCKRVQSEFGSGHFDRNET